MFESLASKFLAVRLLLSLAVRHQKERLVGNAELSSGFGRFVFNLGRIVSPLID